MTRGNTTSKQDIDRQITQQRKHCRTTRWKRPMNNTKCTTARNKIETTTDIMQWRRRQWHHWQSMHMTRTHTTKTTTVGAPPQTCKPFLLLRERSTMPSPTAATQTTRLGTITTSLTVAYQSAHDHQRPLPPLVLCPLQRDQ